MSKNIIDLHDLYLRAIVTTHTNKFNNIEKHTEIDFDDIDRHISLHKNETCFLTNFIICNAYEEAMKSNPILAMGMSLAPWFSFNSIDRDDKEEILISPKTKKDVHDFLSKWKNDKLFKKFIDSYFKLDFYSITYTDYDLNLSEIQLLQHGANKTYQELDFFFADKKLEDTILLQRLYSYFGIK